MSHEIVKGVIVDYKEGSLLVSALEGGVELKIKAAAAINPVLDNFTAKVESGAIDLIKGTDLDKSILLQAVAYIKAEINK